MRGRKIRRLLSLVAVMAAPLSACTATPAPVVDMQGIDPAQHNRDLAACYEEKKYATEWGNPISNCMKAKGYKILVSH